MDNSQEKRAKENISLHNKLSMCSFYSEVVVYWPIKRYSYVIMRDLLHLDLQAINIYQIIIMWSPHAAFLNPSIWQFKVIFSINWKNSPNEKCSLCMSHLLNSQVIFFKTKKISLLPCKVVHEAKEEQD